jgi:hypothetical protein
MVTRSFTIKTLLLFLALVSIASVAWASLTFGVGNRTNLDLGQVTLHSSASWTYMYVPTSGTYVTSVPGSISAITIAGQTTYRPYHGPIAIGLASCYLRWSDDIVEVIDPSEWDIQHLK